MLGQILKFSLTPRPMRLSYLSNTVWDRQVINHSRPMARESTIVSKSISKWLFVLKHNVIFFLAKDEAILSFFYAPLYVLVTAASGLTSKLLRQDLVSVGMGIWVMTVIND